MGASALRIWGQNDIDIYVLCLDECRDIYSELYFKFRRHNQTTAKANQQ